MGSNVLFGKTTRGRQARRRRCIAAVVAGLVLAQGMGQPANAALYFDQVGLDIDGRAAGDRLGTAVAFSADGGRVAVAAGVGYVQVLDWDGSGWSQVGGDLMLEFASSLGLSADGDRVVIGAPGYFVEDGVRVGRVRVFDWDGTAWAQAGADIELDAAWDGFGSAVAMSADGDRVAVAASAGYVQILDWDGSGWSQVGGDFDTGDEAGSLALSADGDRVVIGALGYFVDDEPIVGRVRVFDWDGTAWSQVGADIEGGAATDGFGSAVALSGSGDRLAIGRHGNWDLGPVGAVWVFDLVGGSWEIVDETMGVPVNSVALSTDGRRLAYSASNFFDGEIGRTFIRDETSSGWSDVGDIWGDGPSEAEAALALSSTGDRVAIGSELSYGLAGSGSGQVRVFDLASTPPPPPVSPVSVVPARLLDTRPGNQTVDGVSEGIGRRSAGSVTEVQVTGRGGVPDGAPAVMLNVAAVQTDGPGFVTVYPCGSAPPEASSLNHDAAGQTIANSVFSPIGAGGKVCIYNLAATDLIADVTGYTSVESGLQPVIPARLLDSRSGEVTIGYERWYDIDRARAGSVTEFQVTMRFGVPRGASAVMLNVAVVQPESPGFVTVYPCGPKRSRPAASTVNYAAGQTIANSVFTKVSPQGTVCIYTLATTDLIADVTGYTRVPVNPASVVPARLLETRSGSPTVDGVSEGIGRRAAGSVTEVQMTRRGGVPEGAPAVMLNLAAVQADGPGFVTVYPCGSPRPTASNLNHAAGQTIANSVFTKVGPGGMVCIYTLTATDLIVDVTGHT